MSDVAGHLTIKDTEENIWSHGTNVTVVSSCKPAKHECYTLVKLVTLLHYSRILAVLAIYCRLFHIIIISFLLLYNLHKELTNATQYSRSPGNHENFTFLLKPIVYGAAR